MAGPFRASVGPIIVVILREPWRPKDLVCGVFTHARLAKLEAGFFKS
jgi:hypothetical protein